MTRLFLNTRFPELTLRLEYFKISVIKQASSFGSPTFLFVKSKQQYFMAVFFKCKPNLIILAILQILIP